MIELKRYQNELFSIGAITQFRDVTDIDSIINIHTLRWHFLFTQLFYLLREWGQMILYHMLD